MFDAMERLNPEQRAAVEHLGGPLLVVRTTVRDSAGHPLVHSFSRLRPDVSQVEFEVSVGGR